MKNFSTTFHKKFHIKFFLTKNYGFYVTVGRNLRPKLYGFHMYFSYVVFICGFYMYFFVSAVFSIRFFVVGWENRLTAVFS